MAVSGILVPLAGILGFSVRDSFIPSFANGISPCLNLTYIIIEHQGREESHIGYELQQKELAKILRGEGGMMCLLVF